MDRKRLVIVLAVALAAIAVGVFAWTTSSDGVGEARKVDMPAGERARTEDEPERLLQNRAKGH